MWQPEVDNIGENDMVSRQLQTLLPYPYIVSTCMYWLRGPPLKTIGKRIELGVGR